MKFTKKVSVGKFLKKGEEIKDGDTITIASPGEQVEGKFGTQDLFLARTKGGAEGNVSFNQTTINNLIDGYGEDSLSWVGKEVKVWMIRQNVQGKITPVYYFLHPTTELNEESGKFVLPGQEEDDTSINQE